MTHLKKKEIHRTLCSLTNCSLSVDALNKVCFFPVYPYQLFMKSKKISSIETPLFVTRINRTGRTDERESRDILVVNYTSGSHVQNQSKTQKISDKNQKRLQIFAHLCCSFLAFTDIQVSVMVSKSCHLLCL